mmetsp:Transcript_14947/g.33018  ORF Transcript_14947/g.33018 Transcript_14947/m.33018 type:complete len:375 (-) Transcript_14947:706-1830(-)
MGWCFYAYLCMWVGRVYFFLGAGAPTVVLVTLPSSIVRTLEAKFRLQKVSSLLYSTGDTHTSMSVLLSCERLSCSRKVSVELRKGTCACFAALAAITSPKADKDLLMLLASVRAWPIAPDLLIRSDPARSTRFSLPLVCTPVGRYSDSTVTVNIMCERDECSFMLVAVEERLRSAWVMRVRTEAILVTFWHTSPGTWFPWGPNLTSSLSPPSDRRSWISSLYTSSRLTVITSFHSDARCVDFKNNSSRARVLTPLSSGGPDMVQVLPEPVCPYANMHTLNPSITEVTRADTSLYTCIWFVVVSKTSSNSHIFSRFFSLKTLTSPGFGNSTHWASLPNCSSSFLVGGLHLMNTLMFPLSSWMMLCSFFRSCISLR